MSVAAMSPEASRGPATPAQRKHSAVLEQAAGVLSHHLRISAERAAEELLRVASLHRRPLQGLADEVLTSCFDAARRPNDLRDVIARHWPSLLEPARGALSKDDSTDAQAQH
jgi:hypothetical protein